MARFKILDTEGNTLNTINASLEFMLEVYPDGNYEEEIVPLQPPAPPNPDDLNAHRDERVINGSVFLVTGYGPIPLMGRDKDQIILQSRLVKAQALKGLGVTDPVLLLRDAVNVNHTLTPDQMIELVQKGSEWVEAVMAVSWAMKDAEAPFEDGIPEDYTDDTYWPVGDGV